MATRDVPPTFLGQQIRKRLEQLGISRRELCKDVGLSRQTLCHLEYEPDRGFNVSTFGAVDRGLRWPAGTAEAYYRGVVDAKDLLGGSSVEERIENYLRSIVAHLATMTVDELEREVLMLESEAYGREEMTDADALIVIRETVLRFENELRNGTSFRGSLKDE